MVTESEIDTEEIFLKEVSGIQPTQCFHIGLFSLDRLDWVCRLGQFLTFCFVLQLLNLSLNLHTMEFVYTVLSNFILCYCSCFWACQKEHRLQINFPYTYYFVCVLSSFLVVVRSPILFSLWYPIFLDNFLWPQRDSEGTDVV